MNQFTIVDQLDNAAWERFVCEHPKGSIFHTPDLYRVFQKTKQHFPLLLAAKNRADEIVALLVSVRVQTLRRPFGLVSSRAIMFAEPLCAPDEQGVDALCELLAEHDRRMRAQSLFCEVRPLFAASAERAALERAGFLYQDYLNYIADLHQSPENLWEHMSRQCKGNIRHGKREGVEIVAVDSENDLRDVYRLLQASYDHARVPMADFSLFNAAMQILLPRRQLKINVAMHNGSPLGADLLLLFKDYVFDWYRGLERVKSLYPGECMVWEQLKWAQQNGFSRYDFGGAGWVNVPYGVREFKAKFGGTLVNFGRYRKVYAPRRLAWAERAYEFSRAHNMFTGHGESKTDEDQSVVQETRNALSIRATYGAARALQRVGG